MKLRRWGLYWRGPPIVSSSFHAGVLQPGGVYSEQLGVSSLRITNVDLLLKRGQLGKLVLHRPTNDLTHEGAPLRLSDAHSISMFHRRARGSAALVALISAANILKCRMCSSALL